MKTVLLIFIIILLTSCYPERDSIYNHKDEIIVDIESPVRDDKNVIIITRAESDSGYIFNEFIIFKSELNGLTINDTIK